MVNPNDNSQMFMDNDDMPNPIRAESPPMTPSKNQNYSNETGMLTSQPAKESYASKYDIPSDLKD